MPRITYNHECVLLQVLSASSNTELQQVFKCEEYEALILETGFSKPLCKLKLSDVEVIRASLLDYHCLVKSKAPMDQFKEGLDQVRLGKFLRSHPDELKPMFMPNVNDQLTSGIIFVCSLMNVATSCVYQCLATGPWLTIVISEFCRFAQVTLQN